MKPNIISIGDEWVNKKLKELLNHIHNGEELWWSGYCNKYKISIYNPFDDGCYIWTAEINDLIVGCGEFNQVGMRVHEISTAILKNHRRKGIYTFVLNSIREQFDICFLCSDDKQTIENSMVWEKLGAKNRYNGRVFYFEPLDNCLYFCK